MNDLTVFNFESQPVRIHVENSDTWFCLNDVCNVFEIKDRQKLRARLNARGMTLVPTPSKGGIQKTYFINEPNLYKTILKSDKPQARKFEDWVCEEVLPSIRKTGSYAVANKEKNSTNIDEIKKPLFLPCAKTVRRCLLKSTGKLFPFLNRCIREYTPGCFN